MAKRKENENSGREDRSLAKIENGLRLLAKEGALDFPVTDRMMELYKNDLSEEVGDRLWEKLQARKAAIGRLCECGARSRSTRLPFAGLIRTLRSGAGLSVDDFARTANLKSTEVDSFENDQFNPLTVSTELIANIMETCGLPMSLVKNCLKRTVAAQSFRRTVSGVSARSTGKVSDSEYERALSDLAEFVSKDDEEGRTAELPLDFVSRLRESLERRGLDVLVDG